MKFLIFFVFVGIFVWVAIIPPEGMSKYPAVNVQFDYDNAEGEASLYIGTVSSDEDDNFDE